MRNFDETDAEDRLAALAGIVVFNTALIGLLSFFAFAVLNFKFAFLLTLLAIILSKHHSNTVVLLHNSSLKDCSVNLRNTFVTLCAVRAPTEDHEALFRYADAGFLRSAERNTGSDGGMFSKATKGLTKSLFALLVAAVTVGIPSLCGRYYGPDVLAWLDRVELAVDKFMA